MTELIKVLNRNRYSYKIVDNTVIIDCQKNLNLYNLSKIDCVTIFNNNSDINLNNVELIICDIIFNNKGFVILDWIDDISTNILFNNTSYITLENLIFLTGKITFGPNVGILKITNLDLTQITYEQLVIFSTVKTDRSEHIKVELAKRSGLNIDMLF